MDKTGSQANLNTDFNYIKANIYFTKKMNDEQQSHRPNSLNRILGPQEDTEDHL